MEAIRRRRHGRLVVRLITAACAVVVATVHLRGQLTDVLDNLPTVGLVARVTHGFGADWLTGVGFEVVVIAVAVVLGAVPAHLAARRPPRDEARLESGQYITAADAAHRGRHDREHRPRVGVALGPHASRHHRAGRRSGSRGDRSAT